MKLSNRLISQLAKYVLGNDSFPYRTGSQLVELFNEYGGYDYLPSEGLPMIPNSHLKYARKSFVEAKMKEMNGTDGLRQMLEYVINQIETSGDIKNINTILSKEGFSVEKKEDDYVIIGGVIDNTKPVQNSAHFEQNEKAVLDALDNAKISIRVAMAWFTNEKIKIKLLEKQKEGVDVDIVIYDDGINKKHGVDLSELPYTLVKGSRGGIMHHKFCVIDNQVVLTGSYNWTTNAETCNDENVTIQKDPESATKYSLEFNKLKKSK